MLTILIVLMVLAILMWCSVKMRVGNNRYRMEKGQAIDSPMAEAIAQLIGVAGGIYLSLIMAVSFLGMAQPEKIMILDLAVDPLALVAIVLAFLQPIGLHFIRKIAS